MRRHLTRLAAVAAGGASLALLAGVCAASASPAATPARSGWGTATTIPGTATLNKGGDATGTAISCSSAGNCVTGGFYADALTHDQAFLAVQKKGHWGKAFEIPGTAALNGGGEAEVTAVSCPSAGNCVVTGTYEASGGALEAFVVSQHSGHWGTAAEVRGYGALNVDNDAAVNSLSCSAVGYCTLGGSYRDGADRAQAFLATEAKGHWAKAVEAPGTASLNAGGNGEVTRVFCRGTGDCTAGGDALRGGDVFTAFVLSEKKGTWGQAERVPGMSAINHGGNADLSALSCSSAGNCAAGGYYRPSSASTHTQAYLAVQKGGHWSKATEIPGTASLNKGGSASVSAVSCPASGSCIAAGEYHNSAGNGIAFLVGQHSGHWSKAETLPGLLALEKGFSSQIYSLSCSSPGSCSGVGYYEVSSSREVALVITESGGHWGKAQRVPGIASLSTGNSDLNQVSCKSSGHCSATGFGDKSDHGLAFVVSRT